MRGLTMMSDLPFVETDRTPTLPRLRAARRIDRKDPAFAQEPL